MLSLEVNESSDLTAFDWTTPKWKKKKKVSQFGGLIWNESPRQAPMSHFASSPSAAAERPCADVYMWTWKSSRAPTPLLTSLPRNAAHMQNTNTHSACGSGTQTNTHPRNCSHMPHALWTEITTLHNSSSGLNLQIPPCSFSFNQQFLWTQHKYIYEKKNIFFLLLKQFFPSNKLHWNQNGAHSSLSRWLLLINTAEACEETCISVYVGDGDQLREQCNACSTACNACGFVVFVAQRTSRRHPHPNDSLSPRTLVLAQQAWSLLHSAPWLHWPSVHLAIDSHAPSQALFCLPCSPLDSYNQSCLNTGITTALPVLAPRSTGLRGDGWRVEEDAWSPA